MKRTIVHVPPRQSGELGRNVRRARNRQDGLASPGFAKERQNVFRPPRVELGKRIIEQEDGMTTVAMVAQRRRFEHPQRERRRALLSGRSKGA